jgi:SSS family solute:Na+ symporter
LISFCTGASALVASFFIKQDIISVIESSYRLTVSCLFVPIFIAYFNPSGNKYAALTSIICGGAAFVYAHIFIKYSIIHDLFPLAASLIGYIVVAGTGLLLKRCNHAK